MSQGSVYTKLTLARFFQLLQMHPLHANQVRIETNPHCDQIMFQHGWQTASHVSRDEISEAIAEAEANIEAFLAYHLAPTWDVDEWQATTRHFSPELVNYFASDARGFPNTVLPDWGYFISGGIEAKDLIEAESSIVYSDRDSDGYFETATVTVATSVTDPSQIAIYYPGKDAVDEWEIRPIEVAIAGGSAVITFRRELVVIEDLLEALDIEGKEAIGTDDSDFLDSVDVYRHWNDPQTQVDFLWEPMAGRICGNCSGSGCPQCAYTIQTGCLINRGNPRHSIIAYHPAEWDADNNQFNSTGFSVHRQPDITRLYYYSGWKDKKAKYTNRLDKDWERPIAYMAAARLERPPCDCAKGSWNQWREDLTILSGDRDGGQPVYREPGGGVRTGKGVTGITDNPFGSRRGEVYAWQHTGSLIRGTAVPV